MLSKATPSCSKDLTLQGLQGPQDGPSRLSIVEFFPFSFDAVGKLSQQFIDEERRFAYTTPKSFLELIKSDCSMSSVWQILGVGRNYVLRENIIEKIIFGQPGLG